MNAFGEGLELYVEEKYDRALVCFKTALKETPYCQLAFPYIVEILIIKNYGDVDFYLSYPFKNYLVTDIYLIDKQYKQWSFISEEVAEDRIELSNLSKLILKYFETESKEKVEFLNNFAPSSPIEEYWKNAFLLNSLKGQGGYKGKEADECVNKCIEINQNCALPYFLRHFLQHEIENTSYYLDKALEMKPDYIEALEQRAKMYFDDFYYESFEEVIKTCDTIIYLNPNKELVMDSLWKKGFSLVQLEKYKEGIMCFNQLLQIDNESEIYLNRGSAKNRMKDYSGALADYLKYIELNPTDLHYSVLAVIGTIYLNLKKYNEALHFYTNAIEKFNKSSILYFRRASVFQLMNQITLAENDIKSANKLIIEKTDKPNILLDISEDEI